MQHEPNAGGLPQDPTADYSAAMDAIRTRFFSEPQYRGPQAILARSDAADRMVRALWARSVGPEDAVDGPALLAVGGYGRRELFPASDLDLLFVVAEAGGEREFKDRIRSLTQALWDAGVRVAATTRTVAECQRFDPENTEFTLSLLDARALVGNRVLADRVCDEVVPGVLAAERRPLAARLLKLTRERHARYGDTIFHLEPNIKDCPGGLRDANVCGWIGKIAPSADRLRENSAGSAEFERAFAFLASCRCFLHFRNGRDVNALDWKAQDAAAAEGVGIDAETRDPAYWMQMYFRYARAVERRLEQSVAALPSSKPLLRVPQFLRRKDAAQEFVVEGGQLRLQRSNGFDPAQDFEAVMRAFAAVSESGVPMSRESQDRVEEALPVLNAQMDEGEHLWRQMERILCGRYAGLALRSMHAQGLLELTVPEFHGIDALVVRDAYHRYTVDEHTFVLLDTLHGLSSVGETKGPMAEWARRFAGLMREVQHPGLLFLAALLHDTGKGRSMGSHTVESARLARAVLARLDRDSFESGLVLRLIENHLEMSAALRRDIFDAETVRAFAGCVQTPEELRMLTLFTYADINAVHPDALTPWKAENLWRLYIQTSNYLDRNVDDERVDARVSSDLVQRITALLPGESREALRFLEGFPQRYLQTRSPEQIRTHFEMSKRLATDAVQLDLHWRADRSEITLVTPDRQMLFARIAGVLSSFGMNIITADAFSNAHGVVVDSFRFTDGFRTLELNPEERDRLLKAVHDAVLDEGAAARMIAARRRSRRRDPLVHVETSVQFDTTSSSHATIVQVIAQDQPGLLYTVAQALGEARCDIVVALIDTEGDTAIDVFYLRRDGTVLDAADLPDLQKALEAALTPDVHG
ncbi:[protein-PII] uridylyltransferase family protein [Terriglobus aquaticus]|uniref:Bifunctional uridylyltransferase/uridylyl-removing enzyme n=1 Tax=Terriglobus aquaticus TaxID=940139 RepID=A0ABW9KL09_9BACT|nr:HD domain-containing protein [Terriglobus aquaticus]